MQLKGVRIRHIGQLDDYSLDLDALEGARIVAVTGRNGSGKTTMLESAICGALYRETPTRGSLSKLATARDAMLEARIANGREWTIRHLVDAVSGKGESVVIDDTGNSVLPDAKVTSFDAWSAMHMPPPEVLFASVFAAQGSAGFLGLKPGDRKACLLRILGIERLERLAKLARERQATAVNAAEVARARVADEQARGGSIKDAEAALADTTAKATEAAHVAEDAARALRDAEAAAADSAEALRTWQRRQSEARALRASLATAQAKLADLARRIANNRAVLAEADAINAAVARVGELEQLRRELTTEISRLDLDVERANSAAHQTKLEVDAVTERQRGLAVRMAALQKRLARAAEVDAAIEALPGAEEALTAARTAVDAAKVEQGAAQALRIAGADDRITHLRGALVEAASADDWPTSSQAAARGLAVDDDAVRLAAELPQRLADAQRAVAAAQREFEIAQVRLQQLREVAAVAASITADRRELADLESLAERIPADVVEASARHAAANDAVAISRAAAADARVRLKSVDAEVASLQPTLAKSAHLSQAAARLQELDPQHSDVTTEIAKIEAALNAYGDLGDEPSAPDLDAARHRAASALQAAKNAEAAVALAQSALDAAYDRAARLDALVGDLRDAEGEVSDWTRLATDLGRDGLQAMEIDAAGPELTAIINDLLHSCAGTRWTVSIETTRASADGRKLIEGCEVRVLDTENGREDEASTFSGGERVVIGEAVSLALSMLACRRACIERPTLVRDETGAALDPANAAAYVAMLRRAADIVGADRILVVSHSPDVIELCDARIEIGGQGASGETAGDVTANPTAEAA